MKTSNLKNCITTLKQLRDAYESQIDARVLVQFDEVLADLEEIRDDDQSKKQLAIVGFRALLLIDEIVRLVTNVSHLMK